MHPRKIVALVSLGAMAALGGIAAAPPEDNPGSENGCRGINEAQDRVGEDSPASPVLEEVAAMIGNGCEDEPPASEQKGENGRQPSDG
jgi:hypothetical protein